MVRRIGTWTVLGLEVLVLSLLILAARCANYQDVFAGGDTFFTDGDCYARMTRVRLCASHPGLILRHHDFENFPQGTAPHTTAPLDYLILILATGLRPFTTRSMDLAGAWISPVLAVCGGLFLWFWSLGRKLRYRWAMLGLFALSPILVHGSQLGRPDHESLVLMLVIIAVCSELTLQSNPSRSWSLLNGLAWGLALWVSAYEPLILFLLVIGIGIWRPDRGRLSRPDEDEGGVVRQKSANRALSIFTAGYRRPGWILFGTVLVLALLIERRIPAIVGLFPSKIFRNWALTIGELRSVSPFDPIWLHWVGWLLPAAPFLALLGLRQKDGARTVPITLGILLLATFGLTIWQARWGYFFAAMFCLALPGLLAVVRNRAVVWIMVLVSFVPLARDWEGTVWPNESETARRVEQRHEAIELRELALNMMSSKVEPFLAPWWLSPEIAYWSGQPGIAGTSHESLPGIADSARFFLSDDLAVARDILEKRQVTWVIAYDSDRVEENAALLLGHPAPNRCLARVLERYPAQVPRFLRFSAQNGTGKLYRAVK